MRKELEDKLIKRFPKWFSLNGGARPPLAFRFHCGDGWFETLWRLCVDLESMVTELERERGERFEVVQVKEKVGTLSFYVSHHSDGINERILAAQNESAWTCEVCGQPGKQRKTDGGVRAACDDHAQRPEAL